MYPVQVVERRKPRRKIFYRAAPYTIFFPTEAQIKTRLKFAEIVKKQKGAKGLDPETKLPVAAAAVKKELTGFRTARRRLTKLDELVRKEAGLNLMTLKYRIATAVALTRLRALTSKP